MFVSCYDMFMTLAPATLLSVGCILVNIGFIICGASNMSVLLKVLPAALSAIGYAMLSFYILMFMMGLITLITEWNKILANNKKKVLYLFTFPLFMATYIPISLVALVKKVEWKPITHCISKSVEDIELQQQIKNN